MKIRLTLILAGCLCAQFLSAQRHLGFRQYFLAPRVVSTTISNAQGGFIANENKRAALLSELEYGQSFRKKPQFGWLVSLGAGRRDQIPRLELSVAPWNTLGYPTTLPVQFRQPTMQIYTAKTGIDYTKTLGSKSRFQAKIGPGIAYVSATEGSKIQLLLPYYAGPTGLGGGLGNGGIAETNISSQSVFFLWGDLGFSYRLFKKVYISDRKSVV